MSEPTVRGGRVDEGEYVPAGELQGEHAHFSADQVAGAFGVAIERVHNAMRGEFGLGADARVDSRQAQQLVEVLLGDRDLSAREAALMQLGAYTPRADDTWGIGDGPPGEESDRYAASADEPPDDLASRTGSYDPSQPTGRP